MNTDNKENRSRQRGISRREALKKGGLVTLTAATLMVLMPTPARALDSVPDKMPTHGRPGTFPDQNK